MNKRFNMVVSLMLVIFLFSGAIPVFASGGSSSGGSSSGGSVPSASEYEEVEFDTSDDGYVYGTVGFAETDDINYGVGLNLFGENLESWYVVAELYDEEHNLLTDVLTEKNSSFSGNVDNIEVFLDYNLENKDEIYTVKLGITDGLGNLISDEQTISLKYVPYDIRYAYITAAGSFGINPSLSVELLYEDGRIEEFSFRYRPTINNVVVKDLSNIDETELIGNFAKFEINSNGALSRLQTYSSVASDDDCYVYSSSEEKNKMTCVFSLTEDIPEDTYILCALFDNGLLVDVDIKICEGDPVCFISGKKCTDIKLMNWESLTSLKPICSASDISLLIP